jgi:hypothetical protein
MKNVESSYESNTEEIVCSTFKCESRIPIRDDWEFPCGDEYVYFFR